MKTSTLKPVMGYIAGLMTACALILHQSYSNYARN